MHPVFLPRGHHQATVPVTFVNAATWRGVREHLDSHERAFAEAAGFEPKPGRHLLLPGADGSLSGVLFALEAADDPHRDLFRPGTLTSIVPPGAYRFANAAHDQKLAALAFALGSYRFTRYRKQEEKDVRLELPGNVDGDDLARIVDGVCLARDLINTPTTSLRRASRSSMRSAARRHARRGSSILPGAIRAIPR
jgi:leucyl aminopeptidase